MSDNELNAVIMPDGTIQLEWLAVSRKIYPHQLELQSHIYEQYTNHSANWLFYLGFGGQQKLSPSLNFWCDFSGLFNHKLQLTPDLEERRDAISLPLTDDELAGFLNIAPLMPGREYLRREVLVELWAELQAVFGREIAAYNGSVAEFIRELSPTIHLAGRIYFHLVENKGHEEPFAFLATYSTRLNNEGESRHLPLKYALEEYRDDNEKLLELLITVEDAAQKSPLVAELLESGELFHPLAWSAKEAFTFLREIPLYEESGIICRIPNWWRTKSAGIGLSINVGEKPPSMVGLSALLDFSPQLMIGDTEISAAEARRLLQESEGLAFIKNKWVAVDAEKLKQTLAAYDQARKLNSNDGISLLEAMRLVLNPQELLGMEDKATEVGIAHGKWLAGIVVRLQQPRILSRARPGKDFKAKLRGYQQDGLNWLLYLHQLRFGACLADDMGLGKTVQVLAFLNHLRTKEPDTRASLLIIPASLIANWINELKAFTPSLKYFAAHPDLHKPRQVPRLAAAELDRYDLIITTYALTQRYKWLQDYSWNYIILDEAQAIKNPGTKQTRAVKKLRAHNRLIMTGTPVENRLSDLWSLFDFLNPGLLGNSKEFGRFSKKLAKNPQGYAGLRRIVNPFILRRLKTDKSIITDLPDKVEMKTWAAMTKKQTILYQEIVEGIRQSLQNAGGIQRKGLILSALMKFKQLCNHPSQYLGLDHFEEKESGKFQRLREICETIYEKRERVLVFTQFKEMTAPLAHFLTTIFKREGLILHGSIPVGKRKNLVEKFQGRDYVPFFVLSLKAGGVGLNLTAANHVIHFDRWWNPAVENQATDRVFRIGQQKNVMVHKFLTKGTIEEKIDEMLEYKAKVANEVVAASGESWLTEMTNDELLKILT